MKNLFSNTIIWPDCLGYRISAGILLVFLLFFGFGVEFAKAQTVIGGITPDPSAMLDVQSNNKGVLFPRMTTTERDMITNAPTGLMIFNTTENRLQINLGIPGSPSWQQIDPIGAITSLDCLSAIRKGEMNPTFPASGVTLIIPYTGGNGGTYGRQEVASTGVTGYTATLASGTFANGSGTLTYSITGMSNTPGPANFAFNIGGQNCNLDLAVKSCSANITPTTSVILQCYNLGAYNTLVSSETPRWEINGGYWRWGEKPEAAAGPTGPDADQANADLIPGWDMLTGSMDGSWSDAAKTLNDPCPEGFRVPTQAQWGDIITYNTKTPIPNTTWTDGITEYSNGMKFGDFLMLPAAGGRLDAYGIGIYQRGYAGYYWSSSEATFNGFFLGFEQDPMVTTTNEIDRRVGNSVRCVAE